MCVITPNFVTVDQMIADGDLRPFAILDLLFWDHSQGVPGGLCILLQNWIGIDAVVSMMQFLIFC